MHWYSLIAVFFGGAFLANAVPHVVNGASGRAFQTPFAKPPGRGVSPAGINIVWGYLNLLIAWILLFRVGGFAIENWADFVVVMMGALLMSMGNGRHFGQFYGGR